MTCTHAAVNFQSLKDQGFFYDSLIMEEAGQMLDIEAFIPMALQKSSFDTGNSATDHQLRRIILIGDHNQLPPIVQSHYLSQTCKMDQSLLERLIKVGTPYVQLNAQGRCRPELAQLFSWHYSGGLQNMDHVLNRREFKLANAGFSYVTQFINIEDFQVILLAILPYS